VLIHANEKILLMIYLDVDMRRKLRTYFEKISLDLEKEKELETQWEC
jgi:hypothetical protein